MSQSSPRNPYPTLRALATRHGPVVAALWCLTEALSWGSVGHWLRWLPRKVPTLSFAFDSDADKVKPWWQDGVAIILLACTVVPFGLAALTPSRAALLAAYLIYDAALYHIRALWFDDISPGILTKRREVWSHRRILFLALLHYAQSILLFVPIYDYVLGSTLIGFPRLFQRSFTTATLVSLGHPFTGVDVAQVTVSLFYLAVVISTMASVAYRRPEAGEKS